MTKQDKEMWHINIENAADEASSIHGTAAVGGVFARYDATCFDDLSPSHYTEVYSPARARRNGTTRLSTRFCETRNTWEMRSSRKP